MKNTRRENLALSLFPTLAAAALLLAVCAVFSGCYTLKQGTTLLGYLGRAVPLESLLEDESDEAEASRRFVERVQDIRRFATEELGLNLSKNYTRYVSLDRGYLAAVVSASAADSFTRHEWKYPVVGTMPYKGFFNVGDARKERAKLEKKGLDVWIRGVDAFSTLGWFRDPLYSYMRDYPPQRLADLIIHESLHATVFIKNQVSFNEELAEFVGSEGARLYMESRFGAADSDGDEEENQRFVDFVRGLVAELQVLYKSGAEREEILSEKARIIKAAQERFDEEYETRFASENYRGFSTLPVNNAYLELYRLYHADDSCIPDLFRRSGKSLPEFIAAAKSMPKKGPAGRERLAQALGLQP
ncbi:MAG: aminopeptidase [Treponema sp.]|nr:aminopeptidase [Treponema sp.]